MTRLYIKDISTHLARDIGMNEKTSQAISPRNPVEKWFKKVRGALQKLKNCSDSLVTGGIKRGAI